MISPTYNPFFGQYLKTEKSSDSVEGIATSSGISYATLFYFLNSEGMCGQYVTIRKDSMGSAAILEMYELEIEAEFYPC